MGVSILSLVEIVYYVTLRLACNLNLSRNRKVKQERKNSLATGYLEYKPDDVNKVVVEKMD